MFVSMCVCVTASCFGVTATVQNPARRQNKQNNIPLHTEKVSTIARRLVAALLLCWIYWRTLVELPPPPLPIFFFFLWPSTRLEQSPVVSWSPALTLFIFIGLGYCPTVDIIKNKRLGQIAKRHLPRSVRDRLVPVPVPRTVSSPVLLPSFLR